MKKIVLFGSLAQGRVTPGSDADLLIVLTESDKPFLERLVEWAEKIKIDFPVEVFTYPQKELNTPLACTALETGLILFERPCVFAKSVILLKGPGKRPSKVPRALLGKALQRLSRAVYVAGGLLGVGLFCGFIPGDLKQYLLKHPCKLGYAMVFFYISPSATAHGLLAPGGPLVPTRYVRVQP